MKSIRKSVAESLLLLLCKTKVLRNRVQWTRHFLLFKAFVSLFVNFFLYCFYCFLLLLSFVFLFRKAYFYLIFFQTYVGFAMRVALIFRPRFFQFIEGLLYFLNLFFIWRLETILIFLWDILKKGMVCGKTFIFCFLFLVLFRTVKRETKFIIFFRVTLGGVNLIGGKLWRIILISFWLLWIIYFAYIFLLRIFLFTIVVISK